MASAKSDKRRGLQASLRPRFRGREEMPVKEIKWAEADGRYYGSGKVVIDILTSPISWRADWVPDKYDWRPVCPPGTLRSAGMALRKLDQAIDTARAKGATVADAGEYPLMLEYLCSNTYPDGSKRETSSLVVVSDGSSWRVCLSDRDNARVMWKTSPTLQDALQAIELALMADDPGDWRRSAEASGKRRK